MTWSCGGYQNPVCPDRNAGPFWLYVIQDGDPPYGKVADFLLESTSTHNLSFLPGTNQ